MVQYEKKSLRSGNPEFIDESCISFFSLILALTYCKRKRPFKKFYLNQYHIRYHWSGGCEKLIGVITINYCASNQLILIGKLTNQLLQLFLHNIKHDIKALI